MKWKEKKKIFNMKNLYIKVLDILEEHLQVRHIRGGESTKKKYLKIVNSSVKK